MRSVGRDMSTSGTKTSDEEGRKRDVYVRYKDKR